MLLNGNQLSDVLNPANNFFNSTISIGGAYFTAKNPNFSNQLGFDAKIVAADGVVPNGSTSATVTFVSNNGDFYGPGVATLAIDLYAPSLTVVKTSTNLTSSDGTLRAGDVLKYTVATTNTGQDGAANATFSDALPPNTTFVAGSLQIASGANAGTKTDAGGDDQAEYVAASNTVRFRLGAGANSTTGGTLSVGDSTSVSYQVKVGTTVAPGTTISNFANISATGTTSGQTVNIQSTTTSSVVAGNPTFTITKTHSGQFVKDSLANYTISISNNGLQPTSGVVTVTDPIQMGEQVQSVAGTGWTCQSPSSTVTCTRSDALAPGNSYPPMWLTLIPTRRQRFRILLR